ncbi:dipeptide transport system ATP-binding protein [Ketogulonicigenium robustum]|uniref:Dipeptide transport system ATP-binding protein n=1 Tax=Ketogulonicigenium robustum TaxID=92947 RepID=A0A1W6P1I1_9RHOB|nr:ATP-binding cassette domain-containing protein [Ketogulonicigenium robustum]ARO15190.1 dipeptide transport system ATP-binding protein [Ketogulonicigenium robustum]
MSDIVLKADGLIREYTSGGVFGGKKVNRALKGISLQLERGRTLAVVGESGCGKSTLARILTMIDAQTDGTLQICGQNVDLRQHKPDAALRRKVQIVFQNPYSSLNPRQKILNALTEQLYLNSDDTAAQRRDKALAMLDRVGLGPEVANRYPHMLSGGMRQRVVIARALMVRPEIVVLDEPVSALDLSVQAQVLNLLRDLQDEMGLSYVFISHDLSVVRYLADRLIVMNAGEIVEEGQAADIFAAPQHPYTRKLFAATPSASVEAIRTRLTMRHSAGQNA